MRPTRYSERVFLAIELPRFARDTLLEKRKLWRKQLDEDVKWLPPLNLRLVLRYLGDLQVSKSKQFCTRLEKMLKEFGSFQVSTDKVGCTPSASEATSLWLGVDGGEKLHQLRVEIDGLCAQLKLPPDKKPFEPRIALSRTSDAQRVPTLTVRPELKGFVVKTVSLVETRTGQNGLSYHPRRRFSLADAPSIGGQTDSGADLSL